MLLPAEQRKPIVSGRVAPRTLDWREAKRAAHFWRSPSSMMRKHAGPSAAAQKSTTALSTNRRCSVPPFHQQPGTRSFAPTRPRPQLTQRGSTCRTCAGCRCRRASCPADPCTARGPATGVVRTRAGGDTCAGASSSGSSSRRSYSSSSPSSKRTLNSTGRAAWSQLTTWSATGVVLSQAGDHRLKKFPVCWLSTMWGRV